MIGGFMPSNAAVARRRCSFVAPVERACAALPGVLQQQMVWLVGRYQTRVWLKKCPVG